MSITLKRRIIIHHSVTAWKGEIDVPSQAEVRATPRASWTSFQLIDEAKFKIDANGISLKAVDPAHVAMIDLHLDKVAFEQYSANDTELGIDLDKLQDVIRLAKSGDLIEMRQDEERNRLVIAVGNVTGRMNLVSTEGMSDLKVPNLTLPAKVSVDIEGYKRASRRPNRYPTIWP
ncbi:MAG: hypothetical protein MZV70_01435 [Desulfobacterales bacterium]|nr:hypothetical protein [Desulfobacterales bacterium]